MSMVFTLFLLSFLLTLIPLLSFLLPTELMTSSLTIVATDIHNLNPFSVVYMYMHLELDNQSGDPLKKVDSPSLNSQE